MTTFKMNAENKTDTDQVETNGDEEIKIEQVVGQKNIEELREKHMNK